MEHICLLSYKQMPTKQDYACFKIQFHYETGLGRVMQCMLPIDILLTVLEECMQLNTRLLVDEM